jgi:hypothetical protein
LAELFCTVLGEPSGMGISVGTGKGNCCGLCGRDDVSVIAGFIFSDLENFPYERTKAIKNNP